MQSVIVSHHVAAPDWGSMNLAVTPEPPRFFGASPGLEACTKCPKGQYMPLEQLNLALLGLLKISVVVPYFLATKILVSRLGSMLGAILFPFLIPC